MKFGASCSTLDDSYQASKTAAEKAVAVSSKPDLAIVFNTNNYQQDAVLEAIKGVVGDKKIIGCCTGSVIFDEDKYEKAVVVATIRTNGTRVATALHGGIGKDSYGAGQKAGQELLALGSQDDEINSTLMIYAWSLSTARLTTRLLPLLAR